MSEEQSTITATGGNFSLTINIGNALPGTTGQPIYASATVDAYGAAPNAPSKYFKWDAYASGTTSYQVSLLDPSTTAAATSALESVVKTNVQTTMASSYPTQVSTTMAQSVPAVVDTTIETTGGPSTTIVVADNSGIAIGMNPFGGISSGNVFPGGTTVTAISDKTLTLSIATIGSGVVAGQKVTFTSNVSSKDIAVTDGSGIVSGMTPSGGMSNSGDGFVAGTEVVSVSGNDVTLSKATAANAIHKGAAVSFSSAFVTGTKTIEVASAIGIKEGMIPSGGRTSGNAFSATTSVQSINGTTLTLSEISLDAIVEGADISFSPSDSNQITVQDAASVSVGMSVRGGTNAQGGDSFGPDVFVDSILGNTITLSDPILISGLVVGSNVTFYAPVPSIQIGTIGQSNTVELLIPSDTTLSGGRIIFTLEKPGNFPFNSANKPIAPVPYKGNVKELYYDFVEFAWTSPGTLNNLNYDTSIVDQFGLPITIEFDSDASSKRGIYIDRSLVISQYKSMVPAAISANIQVGSMPSPANVTTFFNELATVMAPQRILAPADAFLLALMPNALSGMATAVSDIGSFFDTVITTFFDTYDKSMHPEAVFEMNNVSGAAASGKGGGGLHDFIGTVKSVKQKGVDNVSHHYRVLQLTDVTHGISEADGLGWKYNIYEPFFSTNGYSSKPVPPFWLTDGNGRGTTATPSEMVFGASGVFADSDVAGTKHPAPGNPGAASNKPYQILLGAIENQIVTATNRGILLAPQWRWLFQSTVNSAVQSPQVTVNHGTNTVTIASTAFVPVYVGMSVVQQTASPTYIGTGTAATPNVVTAVDFETDGTTTVTLSMQNVAVSDQDHVLLNFSYENISNPFYQQNDPMTIAPFNGAAFGNKGVWNYFSEFFHIPVAVENYNFKGVSIDGLAYAYAFDDQGNFSTDISKNNPSNAMISFGQIITL